MSCHLQVSPPPPRVVDTRRDRGYLTQQHHSSNQTEIVQTYPTYLQSASSTFLNLGAKVIISSPTPTNTYDGVGGEFSWVPTIYEWYAWYIVESLGGPEKGIYYVNHGDYSAQALKLMGREAAIANFPMDNTHTSPWLADTFSKAFVLGVKCGTSPFQNFVVNATSRLEGDLLGVCAQVNSTLPIRN